MKIPKITREGILFALALAVMGFVFSMRDWILWMNTLNPFEGLVVYYVIMYACLLVLAHFGLVIWKWKIETPLQVLGAVMIEFAFFITIDWESCYIQTMISGSCAAISNIYFGAEDGAVYYLWSTVTQNVDALRILTYVVTVFAMALIGVSLVIAEGGKPKINE